MTSHTQQKVVRKKMFALDAREAPSRHRPAPERKEAAYFENEELPRLFAELSDASSKTLCLVALKRGIRQGELFALRLGDVDLEQAVVGVRRS
jgi:integrase